MSDGQHSGRPRASSSQQVSAGKYARTEDGVSSCYIFKSRLQEYAQKAGFPTPVYETTKEGLPHEPFFKSTVIVNEVRYDSLLGFMNRKAAEQSAAEVALLELTKSGQVNCRISQPVHETGLCKNLLQEYALKMGYANPLYQHEKLETRKHRCGYQCSVMIGGTKYIGAVATSKKEAEIKAARIAWFAIKESSIELSERSTENAMLTVIPSRKRVLEAPSVPMETTNTASKAKKARFNKKMPGKRRYGKKKPTSQVPESGPSGPISNACHSADGQPGAQFQHMAVGGQAQCQYPRGMEGALGESINNSNPALDNPNLMVQQMGGHGANMQEGSISGKSSNTGWLTLCCGNSGEDSKGDPSVATSAPGDSAQSAVGSSTPALVGDKGCQTANVNHTCAQDSTGVFENSMGDTTMANVEVTEDGKMSVVGTRANDVGSHGANIHNTNGQDSTEILQESKRDTTMASGVTEDAELSAVATQAADVGGEDSTDILQESKGDTTMAGEDAQLSAVGSQAADVGGGRANIHLTNGEDSTKTLQESKGDTAMANGATEDDILLSAAGTQAPDVGGQEGSHGTNIHPSSGLHSTGTIQDSEGDTSMTNGATEDATPSAATEDIVLSAAETQAPVGSQEGSHGTNIHHTNALDSTGMIDTFDGNTSMASGAPEDDKPPDVVRDEGYQTANVHDSNCSDSTRGIGRSKEDATIASEATVVASLPNSSTADQC